MLINTLFGGFNIKSRIELENANYKEFLKLYAKLPNKSEHIVLDIIDYRINHLVKLYNSCNDCVKHEYKKRLEMILQKSFNTNISLDWPNVLDKFILKNTCNYIAKNRKVFTKLLPITVLLEMELDETIKYCNKPEYKKFSNRNKYKDLEVLYYGLSEDDKVEIKIWVLSYLNKNYEISKEDISNYLQPDLNIYEIVNLTRKNESGKKFLMELLKEIAIHSVVYEKNKKIIIK